MAFSVILCALCTFLIIASAAPATINTNVFMAIGASEYIHQIENAGSHYKLGRMRVTADPIYSTSVGPFTVIGYTNGLCRQIYLDATDTEYGSVIGYPNYDHDHQRHHVNGDTGLVGKGLHYCKITLQLPNGRVSLQGHWEDQWGVGSQLVVVAGSGEYQNVRGVAHLSTVNAASCNTNAFQLGSTPDSCLISVSLQLAYPTGVPTPNAATASTSTKVAFEYFGASDFLVSSDDVAASIWRNGNSASFGNPVLNVGNAFNPAISTSYTSGACYETYLSSTDPAYQDVINTVGAANIHPRPGPLAGKSALECYYTIVFPDGQVVLQGIVERDFTTPSTLNIAGGTGAYVHAKGTADRSYLNPASCASVAFQHSSLTSDCVVRTQLNIIQPASFVNYSPQAFWWIECGGGNVWVLEDEIAATTWQLGNYMPFGCPLYSSTLSNLGEVPNGGARVGYDAGDCNKVYLDRRYDSNTLANQRHLPGFHTGPAPIKAQGYWECPWSSVLQPDGSQLLVQGPFADSVFALNIFTVLGGTGQYFGASGEMSDFCANPSNCIAFGFLEPSPACACQYNKSVSIQIPQ
jgi:hypothetical protein